MLVLRSGIISACLLVSNPLNSIPGLDETPMKLFFTHWLQSRRIRFLVLLTLGHLLVFVLLRLVFWFHFSSDELQLSTGTLLNALYHGWKFDVRLAMLMLIPVLLLSSLPKINALKNLLIRRLMVLYLGLVFGLTLFAYIVDFGHFSYLKQRLNASILQFMDDPMISAGMVWQSYPVIWLTLLLLLLSVGYVYWVHKLGAGIFSRPDANIKRWHRTPGIIVVLVVLFAGLYGKLSWYPLRWSDAFFYNKPFATALALNPVLFYFDTLDNKKASYDEQAARQYYPVIRQFLELDSNTPELSYKRELPAKPLAEGQKRPNIIYVILESFAANQFGRFGNTLDVSPNLDRLAAEGLLFENFYVPTGGGTAKSVFTAMTGITDVYPVGTASRNPLIVRQQVVFNELQGYDKYYFIGGSASWGNIRGLLQGSVQNLQLYEEGMYQAPNVDVWGISDLDLFREAHKVLSMRDSDKPFVAVIQTAGNHRPFTIPEDNAGFVRKSLPADKSQWQGFLSEGRYNAVRFMDHAVGQFVEFAGEHEYFKNSVLAFHGDHGIKSSPSPHMYKAYDALALQNYHSPLIFYSPRYITRPARIDTPVGEVDVFPTLAGLAGAAYKNTTMGRDVLSLNKPLEHYAFFVRGADLNGTIGVFGHNLFLTRNHDGSRINLYQLDGDEPTKDVKQQYPDKTRAMSELSKAMFETSRYMLYFNSPDNSN